MTTNKLIYSKLSMTLMRAYELLYWEAQLFPAKSPAISRCSWRVVRCARLDLNLKKGLQLK